MGVTESEWRPPGGGASDDPGWTPPTTALPGASGPPRMGPPERRSAVVQRPVAPARPVPPAPPAPPVFRPPPPPHYPRPVATGQWQGTLKPPTFVVGQPERPRFREPFPVRSGPVWAGLGSGALWMLLFALQGVTSTRAYVWWTIAGGLLGWATALLLARLGDRGVAVGAAVASGIGVAIAGLVVLVEATGGHWVMW